MKKTGSIAAAIILLFIIGTIMTQTKVKGLEKDLFQSVKKGDYYTAMDDADDRTKNMNICQHHCEIHYRII